MRDTKKELLVEGHKLALKHGLGHLTSKVMQEATGFYHFAVLHHYDSVANFRLAVQAHGIAKGTMSADTQVRCPRLSPIERKEALLGAAFLQAKSNGLSAVTRRSVATALGVTDGLVSRYFGSVGGLREAVLAQAALLAEVDIVADAIELQMNTHHVPPELVTQANQILAAA